MSDQPPPPLAMPVMVGTCDRCGAVIGNEENHLKWHRALGLVLGNTPAVAELIERGKG